MKIFSKDAMEMVDIKTISRETENLIVKGKVMGTISVALVVRPEDCWEAARLMGLSVILRLPVLLFKGMLRSRRKAADTAKA